MTYFIHKTASGTQPQSGYERISVYRNIDVVWVLWKANKTVAEIKAEIIGELYIIGDSTDATVLSFYPDLISHKRSRIRAVGAKLLTDIAGEYNAEERETWEEQKAQAIAYLADNTASVPMLEAFAAGRGVPVAILAQGIMDNNALFQVASGQILGQMYALLDQITIAPDLQSSLDVEWP